MLEPFVVSLVDVLAPSSLLLIFIGVTIGVFVGAIPGLTGGMAMALALPFTYAMDPTGAIYLLVGMYVGVVTGGLVSATLLRMPGTPAAVMTTLDGYPMAQKGEAGRALALGVGASFAGCMISWLALVTLAPPLSQVALRLNHFDIFALIVLALALISSLSNGSMLRGLLSAALGALAAMPGLDPVSAQVRLNFDVFAMQAGLGLLPVLIGLFGMSQVIEDIVSLGKVREHASVSTRLVLGQLGSVLKQWRTVLRSSVIGTVIGILPGVGAAVGSIVAYTAAKSLSRTPERFGKGSEEGIVASESANNATVGGALVPMITLGIPGSVADVILLAALILHNVTPGPLLFRTNPEIAYGVMTSMLVGNIFMLLVMFASLRWLVRLSRISARYLLPAIILFSIFGAYAVSKQVFDIYVMLFFGAVGFLMQRGGLPLGPFAIAFILAPMAETSLRSGLMASSGSFAPLITQPVATLTLVAAIMVFLFPILAYLRGSAKTR